MPRFRPAWFVGLACAVAQVHLAAIRCVARCSGGKPAIDQCTNHGSKKQFLVAARQSGDANEIVETVLPYKCAAALKGLSYVVG